MRTTEEEVLEIMSTNLTAAQIIPFLSTANAIVTARLASATPALSDTILAEIEKQLAAHLASVKSRTPFISESIGDASGTFGYKGGEGLKATPYGEMVLLLDTTGALLEAGKTYATIETIAMPLDDDDAGAI